MANNEYTLSHQDVVKAVIIHQNIHEGFWTLNINFNVAATHGPQVPDPCLAVTIKGIGIMRTISPTCGILRLTGRAFYECRRGFGASAR